MKNPKTKNPIVPYTSKIEAIFAVIFQFHPSLQPHNETFLKGIQKYGIEKKYLSFSQYESVMDYYNVAASFFNGELTDILTTDTTSEEPSLVASGLNTTANFRIVVSLIPATKAKVAKALGIKTDTLTKYLDGDSTALIPARTYNKAVELLLVPNS